MNEINRDSLVIYKNQPAIVTEAGKKFEIKLNNGEIKKVRDKDILLIHQGPVKSLQFIKKDIDIQEIWTLLQGETVTLVEFAEFLYGDSSPSSLYFAYDELENGIHFKGTVDSIQANSQEEVEEYIQKERDQKDKQEAYNQSIERLKNEKWNPDDDDYIRDIESVALEQKTSSKILKTLGIKENSLDAQKFLNKIGYWPEYYNPYPGRLGIKLTSPPQEELDINIKNRLDLTHLKSYAIDDEGSNDPDDAISMEGDYKIWIHITDVSSVVEAGSVSDIEASNRGSNLYLPTQTVHMLPENVTRLQALGAENGNNTISYLIEFDENYNIVNRDIFLARVNVTRLSYEEVENRKNEESFQSLYTISKHLKARREELGALTISLPEVKIRVNEENEISIKPIHGVESRNVVSEFMLLAGETAALFCHENNIAIPYATQQPSDSKGTPETDLSSMYVWRRKFKKGETKLNPEPHAGLGFNCYTRATSPLRRYSDLIVNHQIRNFLLGKTLLNEEEVLLKVSPAIDAGKKRGQCERLSNQHWKLVYLSQNRGLVFNGVFVEKKDKDKGVLLIEELAMETTVTMKEFPPLNEIVRVKIKKIDIPGGEVLFSVC
ncbi:MAG: RNB domain-containing ribonuclease [Spirochaetales bacterium]|nr:RNB domain-containing ribonuclease [Spirochaetales bacterium]